VIISVIIINYNSSRFTLDCVASVRARTERVIPDIVVIDNGSAPADWDALQPLAALPGLTLRRSRLNLGFAGGNMLGWQLANPAADYYFFLNNDCVLRTDVCSELAEFMAQTPDAGACSGQMFHADGCRSTRIRHFPTPALRLFGSTLMRWLDPAGYPDTKERFSEPRPSPVVSGSALFVRATAFDAIGGFDVGYFLYCEEEDLCRRLLNQGFRSYIVPGSEYIHFWSQSTQPGFAVSREYYISLFRYYRAHHSAPARAMLRLLLAAKNARKFYKHPDFLRLAGFILRGAPQRFSLRYRQEAA
jgi:GT2 family glycosyltransferase